MKQKEDWQEVFKELLRHNIVEVTFVKKNLQKRTGRMTLNLDLIPENDRPKSPSPSPSPVGRGTYNSHMGQNPEVSPMGGDLEGASPVSPMGGDLEGALHVYDFTRMGWRTIRPAHVTSYRIVNTVNEFDHDNK